MMDDEAKLHENVEKLRGEWSIKTDWGKIVIKFRPYRIGYGSKKGRPDELLVVSVSFPLFGEELVLQVPVPLELESKAGMPASFKDLEIWLERMQKREEEDIYYKYVEIPMIVVGKKRQEKTKEISLRAKVKIKEVSKNV